MTTADRHPRAARITTTGRPFSLRAAPFSLRDTIEQSVAAASC
ncbi:hypothetical protein [Nocardia terrae]|nr:hypothetical protein [Nocardia terrae]